MRTVLFINNHSRRAHKYKDSIIQQLLVNKHGFELIDIMVVDQLESLPLYLKKLRALKDLECLIIGSGDGTIVSILNTLRDRPDIVYGFLPLGTSNTFVRSLGLPQSPKAALEIIWSKHKRFVPLGSINGILFANIAGIGVPVQVVNSLSDKLKRYLGPFAYVVIGIKAFRHHRAFRCIIRIDSREEVFYTHYLLIANGKYHGHLPVAKTTSLFKDELALVLVGTDQSHWQSFKSILRFALRRHEIDPKTKIINISQAEIITEPRRTIEADGEIISRTPAKITIKQNAIKVFTPAQKP